ncbi:MAG TPA: O-antigen ligase family protein [Chitinophagaceae bacterium]|nr:O-antigen ligase family protein [Chitinophagaceae bacterium]
MLFINSARDALDVGSKGLLIYLLVNIHLTPVFLFFILENINLDISFLKIVKPVTLLLFIVSVIIIVIQRYVPFFWMDMSVVRFHEYLDFSQRLFSIYTWVSSNAVGISFSFIVAFLYVNYGNNKYVQFLIAMGALLFAFFTQTRYIIISVVIILAYLYFKTGKFKFSKILFVALVPVLFYTILSSFSFDLDRFIDERILEKEGVDIDLTSAGDRIISYKAFIKTFPDNPVFGNGEKITTDLRKLLGPDLPLIHIGYLHYLYAFGIFGCLLFFTFCGLLMKRVYTMSKTVKDYSAFIGLVAMFIANTTLVWFRFFDFGLFICFLSLITKYNHSFGSTATTRSNRGFVKLNYNTKLGFTTVFFVWNAGFKSSEPVKKENLVV